MVKRERTKKGNRDKMVRRCYSLPPPLIEEMQAASDLNSIPESELIRRAIKMWLEAEAEARAKKGTEAKPEAN